MCSAVPLLAARSGTLRASGKTAHQGYFGKEGSLRVDRVNRLRLPSLCRPLEPDGVSEESRIDGLMCAKS